MSKISKTNTDAKDQSYSSAYVDEMEMNSAMFTDVTAAPGVDTSLCINAIQVNPGESISSEATYQLDNENVEDCDGGFELNNPFVEVLGMWFQVPGTGGMLRAISCPAVISGYKGDCNSLTCAEDAEFNKENCVVEWTSSEIGRKDYILVQNIELYDGEDVKLPIRLTIEDPVANMEEPESDDEDKNENGSGDEMGNNLPTEAPVTLSPTNAPPAITSNPTSVAPLTTSSPGEEFVPDESAAIVLSNTDRTNCLEAMEISLGDEVTVPLSVTNNNFGICSGTGGGIEMDDMDIVVLGSYFKIVGTGSIIRASACPGRIAVFSGTCDSLTCNEILSDQFGCQMVWQTESGRDDYVFVQALGNTGAATSLITLSIENPLETTVPSPSPTDGVPPTMPTGNPTQEADSASSQEPTSINTLESHVGSCRQARSLVPGEIDVIAEASILDGELLECEGNFALDKFGTPVLAAWFSVAGTGGLLRASACPHQLTVYRGSCNALECVEGEVNEFGCEIEWISSENQELDYLVIKTFGFEGEGDDFSLPVAISIEELDLSEV